jgi:hypothetical protein
MTSTRYLDPWSPLTASLLLRVLASTLGKQIGCPCGRALKNGNAINVRQKNLRLEFYLESTGCPSSKVEMSSRGALSSAIRSFNGFRKVIAVTPVPCCAINSVEIWEEREAEA